MVDHKRIVIGGGGFAGLALALALRQGLGEAFEIVVADPALNVRPSRDPRASAIIAAGRNLFEALGVWQQVAAQAQPITDMIITDSQLGDAMRPVFLTFAKPQEAADGEAETLSFAHMVENRFLIDALTDACAAEGVTLRPCAVTSFDNRDEVVEVSFGDAACSAHAFWWRLMAAARLCARAPGSRPMAGSTTSPASS